MSRKTTIFFIFSLIIFIGFVMYNQNYFTFLKPSDEESVTPSDEESVTPSDEESVTPSDEEVKPALVYFPHEPHTDTLNLTIKFIFDHAVVWFPIPPDSKIINVSVSKDILQSYGEAFLRCYKFGYVMLNRSKPDLPRVIQVTCTYGQPFRQKDEYDSLVDPVIQDAIARKLSRVRPGGYLENIEMIQNWSGYPQYEIQKINGEVLKSDKKYQYVIIIPESWQNQLTNFISLKEKKGINVYVATIEWIDQNYFGADTPEKIREFIKDAFNTWSIWYVLLAGGSDIIPPEYVNLEDKNPTDAYYSSLDGKWPDDKKISKEISLYETFIPLGDWLPELVVGRLPVDTSEELYNILEKIINYETDDPLKEWHQKILLLKGWRDPPPGYPPYYDITINEMDYITTTLTSGFNLTSEEVIHQLNTGQSVVFIHAHGGYVLSPNDLLARDIVAQSQNIGNPAIWLAQGCASVKFTLPHNVPTFMLKQIDKGIVSCIGSSFGGSVVLPYNLFFGLPGHYLNDTSCINAKYRPGIAAYQGFSTESIYWAGGTLGVLIGDPEMAAWTGIKSMPQPKLILDKPLITKEREVMLKTVDIDSGLPITDVIIRVINKADGNFFETITNGEGIANIFIPSEYGVYNFDVYLLIRNKPFKTEIVVERVES